MLKKDLLILSCSQSKQASEGLLAAIQRYNGPSFRVLRKFLQQYPTTSLDTYILSAKFGLISGQELIPDYDQKMTKIRSQELQSSVLNKLGTVVQEKSYHRLLICATQQYLSVLQGYKEIIPPETAVAVATGTLGRKLSILHQWLYGHPSQSWKPPTATTHTEKIAIKGINIGLTEVKILEVARQGLAEKKGKPYNYQSWYVLVDEQRVSPKWLVSLITGLPVSSFHSQAARRVLYQLGIEVYFEQI